MALDVIAAGELYIDLVMTGLDRWPKPGEEALAKNFSRGPGGGAAITAVGLSKLGIRTGVIGAVGEDGGWLIGMLARYGVDTSAIVSDSSQSTGATVALSHDGDRAFFSHVGANRGLREAVREAKFEARHLHWAAPVHRDLFDRFHGMTVSFDVGFAHANRETMDALPLVDLFFPNRVEGERMTGEHDPESILRAYAKAGAKTVVLKLGSSGAAMLVENRLLHFDSPQVEAIDTTGAGDCFDAGFLSGWLRGKTPEECLRIGNACGALSTRAIGGIAGFPTPEEIACLEK